MSTDLLSPTLQDHEPRRPGAPLPWRLGSQVYVAILGGVLAVTAIAFLNARMLGLPKRQRWAIIAAGAVGVAALGAYGLVGGPMVGAQLIGAAAWGPMYLLQRPWDRIHRAFGPGEEEDEAYESLLGPGLVAVIAGNLIQGALIAGVHT